MDPLIVFLTIVAAALIGIWYYATVLIPSTIPLEVSNETRLLAYDLYKPLRGEHLHVYRPGTYTLGASRKALLRVPTTPFIIVEQKEEFNTRNVQMEFLYEYELWLVRSNNGDLPITSRDPDDILDWAAKTAYLVYGNLFFTEGGQQKNRWVEAVDRAVRLELETIGRMFQPDELAKPEIKKPILLIRKHTITEVISQKKEVISQKYESGQYEPIPILKPGERLEKVTTDDQLFDLLANHIVEEVNRQHRTVHGLELRPTKFAIHNIEYQDEDMRKVADRRQKASLLIDATQELLDSRRARTPQEAMLIALGQEDKYANLVINTRWQQAVTNAVNKTAGKLTADVVERLLRRLDR